MTIATIFANISCSDISVSAPWYEKLFGRRPVRQPSATLSEWQFSDSAEVQLCERPEHAGHSHLTLGVLPMKPERDRMLAAGLTPGAIEREDDYFVMRITDPDGNEILFASARAE
jgi:hypothetical protein